MTAKRVASAKAAKESKDRAMEREKLSRLRAMVATVLWNFEHNPDYPGLRDAEAWHRLFEHFREVLQ